MSVLLFVCLLFVDKMGCYEMMLNMKRKSKITSSPHKGVVLPVLDGVHTSGDRAGLTSFVSPISMQYKA